MNLAPAAQPTTRARLRQAAIELFGEKGYDGASMTELAERVGIAKPSLYNYYRSKEELLLDLVDDGLSRWIAECPAPAGREAPYERLLRDHLVRMMEFAGRSPHLVGVFHLASMHVQGELAERVDEVVMRRLGPYKARWRERLEEAAATGEIKGCDVAATAAFLAVFFQGLMFQQTVNRRDAELVARHLPGVWRLLFRAVTGRLPKETVPA
jgi:AcrR family transcriptional regulator